MWNFLPKALSFYADERLPLAKQHSGGGSDFLVSEHERKEAHQAPTHPSFLTDQTKPSDSAFSQVQERRNNCPRRNRGGWAVPYSDALHNTRMLSGAPKRCKIQPKLRTLLATDCQSLSFFHFFCLLTASHAKRTSFSFCPQIPVSKAFPRNNPILFPM